jgi:hypothetical protein
MKQRSLPGVRLRLHSNRPVPKSFCTPDRPFRMVSQMAPMLLYCHGSSMNAASLRKLRGASERSTSECGVFEKVRSSPS